MTAVGSAGQRYPWLGRLGILQVQEACHALDVAQQAVCGGPPIGQRLAGMWHKPPKTPLLRTLYAYSRSPLLAKKLPKPLPASVPGPISGVSACRHWLQPTEFGFSHEVPDSAPKMMRLKTGR